MKALVGTLKKGCSNKRPPPGIVKLREGSLTALLSPCPRLASITVESRHISPQSGPQPHTAAAGRCFIYTSTLSRKCSVIWDLSSEEMEEERRRKKSQKIMGCCCGPSAVSFIHLPLGPAEAPSSVEQSGCVSIVCWHLDVNTLTHLGDIYYDKCNMFIAISNIFDNRYLSMESFPILTA